MLFISSSLGVLVLSLTLHTVLALPSPSFNQHIRAWKNELCQSASGLDKKCAGTANAQASNILACPSQVGAVELLCGGQSSNKGAGGLCFPSGANQLSCYCTMGQFFCPGEVPKVATGQSALDYFGESRCNCDGRIT